MLNLACQDLVAIVEVVRLLILSDAKPLPIEVEEVFEVVDLTTVANTAGTDTAHRHVQPRFLAGDSENRLEIQRGSSEAGVLEASQYSCLRGSEGRCYCAVFGSQPDGEHL